MLSHAGGVPLERVAQLYHGVDENFLLTFRELDHYPGRSDATYQGAWTKGWGRPPQWPADSGPRVFAYLKPCPAVEQVFAALRKMNASVVAYLDRVDERTQARLAGEGVAVERAPLAMADVARDCDLAVLNGNHGTTVAMLLAGKPTLQIPIYLEQALFMQAVVRLGAALGASPSGTDPVEARLEALLREPRYRQSAIAFSQRYSSFVPQRQMTAVLERIEALAAAE